MFQVLHKLTIVQFYDIFLAMIFTNISSHHVIIVRHTLSILFYCYICNFLHWKFAAMCIPHFTFLAASGYCHQLKYEYDVTIKTYK